MLLLKIFRRILGFYFGNVVELAKEVSKGKIFIEVCNEW